jgi:hypothetical protein
MGKQLIIGVLVGVILPVFGIFGIIAVMRPQFFEHDIIGNFWMNQSFSPSIQLSLVLNLGIFFLFDKINKEVIARGVIAGTVVWGIYLLVLLFGQ